MKKFNQPKRNRRKAVPAAPAFASAVYPTIITIAQWDHNAQSTNPTVGIGWQGPVAAPLSLMSWTFFTKQPALSPHRGEGRFREKSLFDAQSSFQNVKRTTKIHRKAGIFHICVKTGSGAREAT
jgi:hypothetical protein